MCVNAGLRDVGFREACLTYFLAMYNITSHVVARIIITGYFRRDPPYIVRLAKWVQQNNVKRERQSNFSDAELSCLIEQSAQHAVLFQFKLSNAVTIRRRSTFETILPERRMLVAAKKWVEMKSATLRIIYERHNHKQGEGRKCRNHASMSVENLVSS